MITPTLEAFQTHINVQAAKAGVDISGLEITLVALDRTWGDDMALLFKGTHAARAAECFRKWARKVLVPQKSYDSQYCAGEPVNFKGGVAVSFVYYPCAE